MQNAMKITLGALGLALLLLATPASSNPWESDDKLRTCTRCHDEGESHPVLSILKTPHAVTADPGTPFAQEGCASCHGASEEHMRPPGDAGRAAPEVVFGKNGATPVAEQNALCLTCHESGLRMHWQGSVHDNEDIGCVGCHSLHTAQDPVMAKETQPQACFSCHSSKRAEIMRPSSHPILEGKMACSDCHNPHGSSGPGLLVERTLNETCYTCHAEKRGPFLWEHPPAREDCALCHKPHGSVHPSLLISRGPWLCQQCHDAQYHPSTAYSGTGLPGEATPSGAQQMLGKNCMNCHSQVHGSNHPSGPRLTR